MRVRCGACRTQFEVGGPGRFACPVCGSVNVVRDAAGAPTQQQQGAVGGYPTAPGAGMPEAPPPAPPPPPVLPKITCPECEFTFVIGEIAIATCPNCNSEVDTGYEEEAPE
jgi:hypothetical protein